MFGLFKSGRSGQSGFHGGLTLPGHKLHGEAGRIRPAPLPDKVILPLSQHIGAPTRALVKVGERVLRGQLIADSDSFIAAPVHASISGTVVEIAPCAVPHASGLAAMAIVIESDHADEGLPTPDWPATEDPFSLDAQTLRERVRRAGLVGLGGAAFPSSVKLNPGSSANVNTLILNGIECEPYISCDAALMQEHADAVIAGAELIRRVLGAQECLIGLEDNAPEAAAALRQAINQADYGDIEIRVVPTRYPQGGEKQLIQALTGKEVPREGLPLDIGIVVHNVGTVAAIWRAIRYAQPLISRIVTVNGPGIRQPQNLEVRLGTPVAELIAHCGGYTQTPRLIMGGPMMGFALSSDAVPVVKATNCILVEVAQAEPADTTLPCIRCGECVDVCPANLLPQQLYWQARAKAFDKAQELDLFDCIECGCCAQVCPSNIPLVQYYRYAKTEIYQAEKEKRKADIARNRHEFRQQRLEAEAREKEEARRRKREALKQKKQTPAAAPASAKTTPANDAIAAAIAKAKAEKARRLAQEPASAASAQPDAISAAIAKAQAQKAQRLAADSGKADPAARTDQVAAAIAKARAARTASATAEAAADPVAPGAAAKRKADRASTTTDPVAAAIAKARAAKQAASASGDTAEAVAPAGPAAGKQDAVAAAIAQAKAARKPTPESASKPHAKTPDPVAAAIAKAKAAKAAREKPS